MKSQTLSLSGTAIALAGVASVLVFAFELPSCEAFWRVTGQGTCLNIPQNVVVELAGSGFLAFAAGLTALVAGIFGGLDPIRSRPLLLSLTLTILMNSLAGVLTLGSLNGSTVFETNPISGDLIRSLGVGSIAVHTGAIAALYPLAYLLQRITSSSRPIFLSSRGMYLFTFSLLIAALPVGALVDMLNDALVVFWRMNILVGPGQLVFASLACALPLAALLTAKNWNSSVPKSSGLP